jgi:2-polyprenyl-6-methoxyphenol hydroxylase-like FAD-dependent oxidoreductase
MSEKEPTTQNLHTEGTATGILSALPTLFPSPACPSLVDSKICVIGGSIGGLCIAASLVQSGFSKENGMSLERSLQAQPGAGIGLDDASSAIMWGLGLPPHCCDNDNDETNANNNDNETATCPVAVQQMRHAEEHFANGQALTHQPHPCLAIRCAKLVRELENALADGAIVRGQKAFRIKQLESSDPDNK